MHTGYTLAAFATPRRPRAGKRSIGFVMSYYRYRTATLRGPWRDSRLKAECDAVAAGQAEFAGGRGEFRWRVEGSIEAQAPEPGKD